MQKKDYINNKAVATIYGGFYDFIIEILDATEEEVVIRCFKQIHKLKLYYNYKKQNIYFNLYGRRYNLSDALRCNY